MKKILLSCVLAVGLLAGCVQQKVSSFSSVSQQIAFKQSAFTTFDNRAYLFVYGTPTLNEYVPRGEDISNWQNLLAVELFPDYTSITEALNAVIFDLNEQQISYQVLENKALGMTSINYVLQTPTAAELNVWKFEKPSNWRGVIGYRMAKKFQKVGGIAQGFENKQYYINQFLRTRTINFIH